MKWVRITARETDVEYKRFYKLIHDQQDTEDEWWIEVCTTWDGCMDISRAFNEPFPEVRNQDVDTIHICEVKEFIECLSKLQEELESWWR